MSAPFEPTPGTWAITKQADTEFTLDGDFAALAGNLSAEIDAITWTVTDVVINDMDCHTLSGTI